MEEYIYSNLTRDEIIKLFYTLPEAEEGVIVLERGCDTGGIDEEEIKVALEKGWSVVM